MESPRKLTTLLIIAGMVVLAGCAGGISGDPAPADPDPANGSSTVTTNGSVEIHYINVGQSVSTLITSPNGETMLVDTGHYNDDGEHVLAYLQRHDISRIDHLVTSHSDADHIGGNAAIIEYYETEADGIGAVYDPGIASSTQTYAEYLDAIEARDVTLYETREGDTIDFGDVDVNVLGPPDPYLENEDRNENSIVLKLTHGETSVLLSGDAEDDQEAYLVDEYGSELESTILKAGHHGSASSSSGAFLDAVDPQAVVISSAYDSQYGHPHEEVLERLAERSHPAYWTATHGNIILTSDGQNVTIQTQQDVPTDPSTLREGVPIEVGAVDAVSDRARIESDGTTSIDTGSNDTPDDTDSETDETTAEAGLTVAEIHADAAGDDRDNLNDEYVVFENTGNETLDLSGWTIEDEAGQRYTVPAGFELAAGETVTLHTGSGTGTTTELYWGSGSPIWNNNGDTVIVSTPNGEPVLEETYS
ncbi:lamin tail domain-containing protein [Halalkaliarchaeum sp. AArc-GB]|uniref:lamin tail domain-containing protein n=1 Tax=Halalkaliarchaeum sp. AArc-GB TaxID=3074078 RepID=UPI0028567A28|nr:lamin tail domain-containing protein [Halalkaliarchaeum sp. AArc-GB]MDR5673872.1 lamin tail domain-containing protein [Halalkaliarchaeum sp. AArc-GB]